jgi:hypothetical protein
MFGLWSRGSPSDASSLNSGERKYFKMLLNIAGWLPAPAPGWSEDHADVDPCDEVETSGEETVALQPEELENYEIIDEHNINRSYFTEPSK